MTRKKIRYNFFPTKKRYKIVPLEERIVLSGPPPPADVAGGILSFQYDSGLESNEATGAIDNPNTAGTQPVLIMTASADQGAQVNRFVVLNWGDGGTDEYIDLPYATTGSMDGVNATYTLYTSHLYSSPDSYTVTVVAAGGNEDVISSSTTLTFDLTVPNLDLAATAGGQPALNAVDTGTSIVSGTTIIKFTDTAGTNALSGDYSATIDWDGTGTAYSAVAVAPADLVFVTDHYEVRGSNTYAAAGTYTIDVVVTDADGDPSSGDPGDNETFSFTNTIVVNAPIVPLTASGTLSSVAEGSLFSGTLATFVDATPNALSLYDVSVDWGDGSAIDNAATVSLVSGTYYINGQHTYSLPGDFIPFITLAADGGTSSVSDAIHVTDAGLTGALVGIGPRATVAFSNTEVLGYFSDNNLLGGAASNYSVSVIWEVGATAVVGNLSTIAGMPGFIIKSDTAYTYAATGAETMTINITDLISGVVTPFSTNLTVGSNSNPHLDHGGANGAFTAAPTSFNEGSGFLATPVTILARINNSAGTGVGGNYRVDIAWGDGASVINAAFSSSSGNVPSLTHAYADDGFYFRTITLKNSSGVYLSTITDLVTVNNKLPRTISAVNPSAISEGAALTDANIATFTEPNSLGNAAGAHPGDYYAVVNWGDGSYSSKLTYGSGIVWSGSLYQIKGNHTFSEPGNYTISTTLYDSTNSIALGSVNSSLVVDSPISNGTSATSGLLGSTLGSKQIYLGSFTDLTDPDPAGFSASVTWGDGSGPDNIAYVASLPVNSEGIFYDNNTSTYKIYGYHDFNSSGQKTFTATISDNSVAQTPVLTGTISVQTTITEISTAPLNINEGGTITTSNTIALFDNHAGNHDAFQGYYTAQVSFDGGVTYLDATVTSNAIKLAADKTFSSPDSFSARVKITNTFISSSDAEFDTSIIVNNVPISNGTSATSGLLGSTLGSKQIYLGSFTDLTDPNPAGFSASVTWGDGSGPDEIDYVASLPVNSEGIFYDSSTSTYKIYGYHDFNSSGQKTFTATISDDGVAQTPILTGTISVQTTITEISIPPLNINEGGTITTSNTIALFDNHAGNHDAFQGYYTAQVSFDGGVTYLDATVTSNAIKLAADKTFSSSGSFGAHVKITNTFISSSDAEFDTSINVDNLNVVLSPIASPTAGQEGAAYTEILATFTDPGGYDGADLSSGAIAGQYSATVDWDGPGSLFPVTATIESSDGITFSVRGSETFSSGGHYFPVVSVTHGALTENTAANAIDVDITSYAFDAESAGGTTLGSNVVALRYILGSFTDQDPNGDPSLYSATINWGNETETVGYVSGGYDGVFANLPSGFIEGIIKNTSTNRYDVYGSSTSLGGNPVSTLFVSVSLKDNGVERGTLSDAFRVQRDILPFSCPAIIVSEGDSILDEIMASFSDFSGGAYYSSTYSARVSFDGGITFLTANDVDHVSDSDYDILAPEFAYPSSGIYRPIVEITTTFSDGSEVITFSVNDGAHITVLDVPFDTQSAGGTTLGSNIVALTYNLGSFTDADPDGDTSLYSAEINWGGETETIGYVSGGYDGVFANLPPGFVEGIIKNTSTNRYDVYGSSTSLGGQPSTTLLVTVSLLNDGVEQGTLSHTFDVQRGISSIGCSPITVDEGSSLNGEIVLSFDDNSSGDDFTGTYTAFVSKDGVTYVSASVEHDNQSIYIVKAGNLVYGLPGDFHPFVKIVVTFGNSSEDVVLSGSATALIHVDNLNIDLSPIASPPPGVKNVTYSEILATFTDPGGYDGANLSSGAIATQYSATVDWDGPGSLSPESAAIESSDGITFSVRGIATFSSGGDYFFPEVTVTHGTTAYTAPGAIDVYISNGVAFIPASSIHFTEGYNNVLLFTVDLGPNFDPSQDPDPGIFAELAVPNVQPESLPAVVVTWNANDLLYEGRSNIFLTADETLPVSISVGSVAFGGLGNNSFVTHVQDMAPVFDPGSPFNPDHFATTYSGDSSNPSGDFLLATFADLWRENFLLTGDYILDDYTVTVTGINDNLGIEIRENSSSIGAGWGVYLVGGYTFNQPGDHTISITLTDYGSNQNEFVEKADVVTKTFDVKVRYETPLINIENPQAIIEGKYSPMVMGTFDDGYGENDFAADYEGIEISGQAGVSFVDAGGLPIQSYNPNDVSGALVASSTHLEWDAGNLRYNIILTHAFGDAAASHSVTLNYFSNESGDAEDGFYYGSAQGVISILNAQITANNQPLPLFTEGVPSGLIEVARFTDASGTQYLQSVLPEYGGVADYSNAVIDIGNGQALINGIIEWNAAGSYYVVKANLNFNDRNDRTIYVTIQDEDLGAPFVLRELEPVEFTAPPLDLHQVGSTTDYVPEGANITSIFLGEFATDTDISASDYHVLVESGNLFIGADQLSLEVVFMGSAEALHGYTNLYGVFASGFSIPNDGQSGPRSEAYTLRITADGAPDYLDLSGTIQVADTLDYTPQLPFGANPDGLVLQKVAIGGPNDSSYFEISSDQSLSAFSRDNAGVIEYVAYSDLEAFPIGEHAFTVNYNWQGGFADSNSLSFTMDGVLTVDSPFSNANGRTFDSYIDAGDHVLLGSFTDALSSLNYSASVLVGEEGGPQGAVLTVGSFSFENAGNGLINVYGNDVVFNSAGVVELSVSGPEGEEIVGYIGQNFAIRVVSGLDPAVTIGFQSSAFVQGDLVVDAGFHTSLQLLEGNALPSSIISHRFIDGSGSDYFASYYAGAVYDRGTGTYTISQTVSGLSFTDENSNINIPVSVTVGKAGGGTLSDDSFYSIEVLNRPLTNLTNATVSVNEDVASGSLSLGSFDDYISASGGRENINDFSGKVFIGGIEQSGVVVHFNYRDASATIDVSASGLIFANSGNNQAFQVQIYDEGLNTGTLNNSANVASATPIASAAPLGTTIEGLYYNNIKIANVNAAYLGHALIVTPGASSNVTVTDLRLSDNGSYIQADFVVSDDGNFSFSVNIADGADSSTTLVTGLALDANLSAGTVLNVKATEGVALSGVLLGTFKNIFGDEGGSAPGQLVTNMDVSATGLDGYASGLYIVKGTTTLYEVRATSLLFDQVGVNPHAYSLNITQDGDLGSISLSGNVTVADAAISSAKISKPISAILGVEYDAVLLGSFTNRNASESALSDYVINSSGLDGASIDLVDQGVATNGNRTFKVYANNLELNSLTPAGFSVTITQASGELNQALLTGSFAVVERMITPVDILIDGQMKEQQAPLVGVKLASLSANFTLGATLQFEALNQSNVEVTNLRLNSTKDAVLGDIRALDNGALSFDLKITDPVSGVSGTVSISDVALDAPLASGAQVNFVGNPVAGALVGTFTDANASEGASIFTVNSNNLGLSSGDFSITKNGNVFEVRATGINQTQTGVTPYALTVGQNNGDSNTIGLRGSISIQDTNGIKVTLPAAEIVRSESPTAAAITLFTFIDAVSPLTASLATNYAASIDWGDGLTSVGTVTVSGGVYTVKGTRAFDVPGLLAPQVSITNAGVTTLVRAGSLNIKVNDVALSLVTTPAVSGFMEDTPLGNALLAQFKDNGGLNNGSIYRATVDWKDGSSSIEEIQWNGSSFSTTQNASDLSISYDSGSGTFSVRGDHQYFEGGTYSAAIVLSHDQAANTSTSKSLVIGESAAIEGADVEITVTEANKFSGIVAYFRDSDLAFSRDGNIAGIDSLSHFKATIDWDGAGAMAPVNGTIAYLGGDLFSVSGTVTLPNTIELIAKVVVTHDTSAPLTIDTPIHVQDAAITYNALGYYIYANSQVNGEHTFSGTVSSFKDAKVGATVSQYSQALITWGDGYSDLGRIEAKGGGIFNVVFDGTHTFANTVDVGLLTGNVTITQANGGPAIVTGLYAQSGQLLFAVDQSDGSLISIEHYDNLQPDSIVHYGQLVTSKGNIIGAGGIMAFALDALDSATGKVRGFVAISELIDGNTVYSIGVIDNILDAAGRTVVTTFKLSGVTINKVGTDFVDTITGLAIDPMSGNLFGVVSHLNGTASTLFVVDKTRLDLSQTARTAYANTLGNLVGQDEQSALIVNNARDMLFNPTDGKLYVVDGTTDKLYEINKNTGHVLGVANSSLLDSSNANSPLADVQALAWDGTAGKAIGMNSVMNGVDQANDLIGLSLDDVGLDTTNIHLLNSLKDIQGMSFVPQFAYKNGADLGIIIDLSSVELEYTERSTTPLLIASTANIIDYGTPAQYGSLTVDSTGLNEALDVLSISDGTKIFYSPINGDITYVAYSGATPVVIGSVDSFYDGKGGRALQINFNSSATSASVTELMKRLSFRNTANIGVSESRAISIILKDVNDEIIGENQLEVDINNKP